MHEKNVKVVDGYGHLEMEKSERTKRWEEARTPRQKLEFQKWSVYPENFMVDRVPLSIDFEATSRCNLKCRMCPRTQLIEEGKFWEEKDADLKLYLKVVDEAAEKGVGGMKYAWLGEPLLNRDLPFMIYYAKYKGIPMVMFNTNAVLLTTKKSEQLIGAGLDQIFFSDHILHLESEEVVGSVLAHITNFHKIREYKGSISPHTRINFVFNEENKGEIKNLPQNPIAKIVDSYSYTFEFDYASIEDLGEMTFCCPQLWQRMFIHPDGLVTPCCADMYRKLVVGNIKESSIEEIWTGEIFEKLRKLHKEGRAGEIPTCRACDVIRVQGTSDVLQKS